MNKQTAATVTAGDQPAATTHDDQSPSYDSWMSAHEIAEMFRVSVRTVLRWAADEKADPPFPPSFPHFGTRRWKRSRILAYRALIESRTVKAGAQLVAFEQRQRAE